MKECRSEVMQLNERERERERKVLPRDGVNSRNVGAPVLSCSVEWDGNV